MINRVILQGYVGNDPEIRSFESGSKMARIRLATTETVTIRQSGESRKHTEWHTVIFWREGANFVDSYIRKGAQIYVEGALRSREWTNREGVKQTLTEIVGSEIKIIAQPKSETAPQRKSATPEIVAPNEDLDNLPF